MLQRKQIHFSENFFGLLETVLSPIYVLVSKHDFGRLPYFPSQDREFFEGKKHSFTSSNHLLGGLLNFPTKEREAILHWPYIYYFKKKTYLLQSFVLLVRLSVTLSPLINKYWLYKMIVSWKHFHTCLSCILIIFISITISCPLSISILVPFFFLLLCHAQRSYFIYIIFICVCDVYIVIYVRAAWMCVIYVCVVCICIVYV